MTFVSRRKALTRNRPAVQMSGHARAQGPLRGAAKREGSRRVRLRSLPERARPRFRAVAVVPWPSLPPRGASEQASAAGERPAAEPRSQRAWCRVPLPGGGDERREVSTCGLRSRWPCFRERCRKNGSCEVRRQGAFHRGPLSAVACLGALHADWRWEFRPASRVDAGQFSRWGPEDRRSLRSAPFGLLAVPFPLQYPSRLGRNSTTPGRNAMTSVSASMSAR